MHRHLLLATLGTAAATPGLAYARSVKEPNPQTDYARFQDLTGDVRHLRSTRLLPFARFKEQAAPRDTLLLDARSETAFREGHIKGAANLPLPDFNADSLGGLIGRDHKRMILIYCNNNFSNRRRPVSPRTAPLELNIQTFINLVGYGYPCIWELGGVIDFTDSEVEWVRA